mmetsp:Transcript_10245/g.18841  ORF Transcript_10245/g.18841 Transcript_10245/m.18841 type:complete len:490 (-) Transcript_10245:8-1477(-)
MLEYEEDEEARALSDKIFEKLDIDSSGYLCQDELLKARDFMMRRFGEASLATHLEESDENADGVIDNREWHSFCEGVYEMLGRKQYMDDLQAWAEDEGPPTSPSPKRGKSSPGSLSPKTPTSKKAAASRAGTARGTKRGTAMDKQEKAATKIQSMHRKRKAIKEVEEKKTITKLSKSITVADIWDIFALDGGTIRTTIPVGDVINLYADCRFAGMDMNMANSVPMHFETEGEPEDLTVEEVAHLCKLLIDDADLTEEAARESLGENRPFPTTEDRRAYARMDGLFNLKRLRRLVSLLTEILRIDEEYILLQMQFVLLGVFEMTDTMTALIMERGTVTTADSPTKSRSTISIQTFDSEFANESVLEKKFNLDAFQRLLYNGGVVDSRGKQGVLPGDISLIYSRGLKNMVRRAEERAGKKRGKVSKGEAKRAADSELLGRSEFELMLQELHDIKSVQAMFPTPIILAIQFATKAREASVVKSLLPVAEEDA